MFSALGNYYNGWADGKKKAAAEKEQNKLRADGSS